MLQALLKASLFQSQAGKGVSCLQRTPRLGSVVVFLGVVNTVRALQRIRSQVCVVGKPALFWWGYCHLLALRLCTGNRFQHRLSTASSDDYFEGHFGNLWQGEPPVAGTLRVEVYALFVYHILAVLQNKPMVGAWSGAVEAHLQLLCLQLYAQRALPACRGHRPRQTAYGIPRLLPALQRMRRYPVPDALVLKSPHLNLYVGHAAVIQPFRPHLAVVRRAPGKQLSAAHVTPVGDV
ncbi:hypothetical protein HRbin16_00931 [bacterium HR16]|nr:hypothetical protein HRbin16_00931 [bacterium HR16]